MAAAGGLEMASPLLSGWFTWVGWAHVAGPVGDGREQAWVMIDC